MLVRRYSKEASRARAEHGGASADACMNVSSHAFMHSALYENSMLQTIGNLALFAEYAPTQQLRDTAVGMLRIVQDGSFAPCG